MIVARKSASGLAGIESTIFEQTVMFHGAGEDGTAEAMVDLLGREQDGLLHRLQRYEIRLERLMQRSLCELRELKEAEDIAKQTEKPTFENTIVALEKSGQLLTRARRVFSNFGACNTNPAIQKPSMPMG